MEADRHSVQDLVQEAVRAIAGEHDAMRRIAIENLRWLTFEDVQEITGFSARKLRDLVQDGTIPMFRAPDSNQWRITLQAWAKTERRLERDGMAPKKRFRR